MATRARVGLLMVALLGPGTRAWAQSAPREGFRLERYSAPPTSRDGFALMLPSVLGHLQPAAQLTTHYALSSLAVRTPSERELAQHRLAVDMVAALGLFDALEIYARVPVVLFSSGENALFDLTPLTSPSGAALSDMALGATALLVSHSALSMGGRAELIVPSGSRKELTSDGAVEARGELVLAYTQGRLLLALSGGGALREHRDYAQFHVGPELWGGALLRARLSSQFDVLLESVLTRGLAERDAPSASDGAELFVGARRRGRVGPVTLALGAAVGAGLTDLAGEPAFRTLLNLALEPNEPASTETAPKRVPVADGDQDGVPDAQDLCREQLEDLDAFQDTDGCPDVDDDRDGVDDAQDACPRSSGLGRNGCPTDDLDEDGIPDERDRCPRDAEDLDQDRDEDGCPDKDSDGDGLTDDQDVCPDLTGLREKQGCLAHARLERDRMVLASPIAFDDKNIALAFESGPVLDDMAALLASRPQLQAELVVHLGLRPTPDRGEAVGAARAALLIQGLVARGIDRTRLTSRVMTAAPATDHVEIVVRVPGTSAPLPAASPGTIP